MKFLAKYLLYTQGDSEGRKLRDQALGGLPGAENDAALAGANIHSEWFAARRVSCIRNELDDVRSKRN